MSERMEALERVDRSLEEVRKVIHGLPPHGLLRQTALSRLGEAHAELERLYRQLRALPAPQPEPAGEAVEFALWADKFGSVFLAVPGTDDDASNQGHRRRLGTTTLPIQREGGEG